MKNKSYLIIVIITILVLLSGCTKKEAIKSGPNMPCAAHTDCVSLSCSGGKCECSTEERPCEIDAHCCPSLSCRNDFCVKLSWYCQYKKQADPILTFALVVAAVTVILGLVGAGVSISSAGHAFSGPVGVAVAILMGIAIVLKFHC